MTSKKETLITLLKQLENKRSYANWIRILLEENLLSEKKINKIFLLIQKAQIKTQEKTNIEAELNKLITIISK